MTSSELWNRATAERYDAEETENSSATVLEPALTFLAELAGDGRALEFAIGTGRVGVPLRERGVQVVGIELSEHMAAVLRRKVDEDTLPVTLGDMATTVVPGRFTLAYLVYNTIGNLLTQDEQVECFRNAARHLAPGGRFVIELGVPPLRFLPPGQVAVPFDVSERHLGFDTFDLVEQLLVSHHFTRDGEDGRYRRGSSRQRYAWPAELDLMARIAGLELELRVADWDRAQFTEDSTKHVSVWRKPSRGTEARGEDVPA
ncbi:class I SAM-dependent methyltransferase [Streptomyces sp. B1I3]|uniref:class I SAM-dependent DNA methyltransferase n=1 Tax=Streptomyces sp. B1I3 TaxID=3042264 RepID=UPI0027893FB6|nr:class I SAM-dependent methyltransferase [Streptomyces sp. B1I3]MDQ0797816.1 SAM-dependent methyltransferase [Streptomyces sp. B1I3]